MKGSFNIDWPAWKAPLRRFWDIARRHWRVLAVPAGVLSLLMAAVALVPINMLRRASLRRDVREAARLFKDDEPFAAFDLLSPIDDSRLRFDPSIAGEVHYLTGAVANQLASMEPGPEGDQYRGGAMTSLRTASRLPVPPRYAMDLVAQLGTANANIGDHRAAQKDFRRAVAQRRMLRAVLLRRMAQATTLQDPVDSPRVEVLVRRWAAIPGMPGWMTQAVDNARKRLASGGPTELSAAFAEQGDGWLPESVDPPVRLIDRTAGSLLTEKGPEAALEYLQAQASKNRKRLSSALGHLASEEAADPFPDNESALRHSTQRVALLDDSTVPRAAALREHGELLLKVGRPTEARQAFAEAGSDPNESPEKRLRTQFLLANSYIDEARRLKAMSLEQWEQRNTSANWLAGLVDRLLRVRQTPSDPRATRVADWRIALSRRVEPDLFKGLETDATYLKGVRELRKLVGERSRRRDPVIGRALLTLGEAYVALRDYPAAKGTFARATNEFPRSDIEQAARFLRADAARLTNDADALEAFESASDGVEPASSYRNDYLPLDDLRSIFEASWRQYEDADDQRTAIRLATLYEPFAAPGEADRLLADSQRSLADELMVEVIGASAPAKAESIRSEARRLYREAGKHFAKVAMAKETSSQYPDFLWNSALALFDGHGYESAVEVLEAFIEVHGRGERAMLANLLLARSQMALGRFAEAGRILMAALERDPRSPNRFEARLRLAQCYMEMASSPPAESAESGEDEAEVDYRKAMLDRAEATLRQNTDGLNMDLDPSALAWRRSLFALGHLLYIVPRYDEAVARLREASRRYPDDPETLEALYRIADAYYMSSREPTESLQLEQAPRTRSRLLRQRDWRLEQAIDGFAKVVERLIRERHSRRLSEAEEQLLQSGFFRIGDAYYDLEEWSKALDAYSTAATEYQDKAVSLVAYVRIAFAYRKLDRDGEARSTLRQALWVLENELSDDSFAAGALSKEEWKDQLEAYIGDL